MIQSTDKTIVQSAKIILSNLLYHPEYRDVFVLLLRNYNEATLPINFLQDVVEMTHVYLRLVNLYSKQNGQVVIQKKRKSHRVNKRHAPPKVLTEEQLLETWGNVENEVNELLNCDLDVSELPCPFDAASLIPIVEQKYVSNNS